MNNGLNISMYRFLVVEDEDFQREAMVMLLNSLGAEQVHQAENGRVALELVEDKEPLDIILLDIEMPEIDGMAFLRHMRDRGYDASVILVSGLSSAMLESVETMDKAYGINILGAMPKPASRSRLLSLIARHDRPRGENSYINNDLLPEHEIVTALRNGEFLPYFQPKVEMASGRVCGVEALVRWNSPDRGLLPPGVFLDSIEAYGLMDDLTWAMLEQAAAICRGWQEQGLMLTVSVNLSLSSLGRLGLAEHIHEVVSQQGLTPSSVILEVTETAAMADVGHCLENLTRLRLCGFGLSIDDYGTGYSSMQQLTRVPFTELKIDQSFVKSSSYHESTRIVVESSLDIAHKLGLYATAEGIETHEHWDMLKSMDCDIAQGYLIAKPMDASAIPAWVASWKGVPDGHASASLQQTVNILLVEDEDFQRETYGEILERMELGLVHTAANVDAALEMIAANDYDLIVTDVELGGRTGLDLVKLVRTLQTSANPATRVVILSSRGDQNVVFGSISLDINGFLVKPATMRALHQAIHQALEEEFTPQPVSAYQNWTGELSTASVLGTTMMTEGEQVHPVDGKQMPLSTLTSGMILAEPLYTKDKHMVLPRGQILTHSMINRLLDLRDDLAIMDVTILKTD